MTVALAAATVLLQIAYPLVRGEGRDLLTVVTVVVFFLASTSHALVHRGGRWTAAFVAVTFAFAAAISAELTLCAPTFLSAARA